MHICTDALDILHQSTCSYYYRIYEWMKQRKQRKCDIALIGSFSVKGAGTRGHQSVPPRAWEAGGVGIKAIFIHCSNSGFHWCTDIYKRRLIFKIIIESVMLWLSVMIRIIIKLKWLYNFRIYSWFWITQEKAAQGNIFRRFERQRFMLILEMVWFDVFLFNYFAFHVTCLFRKGLILANFLLEIGFISSIISPVVQIDKTNF